MTFIENIYYPYTVKQLKELNKYFNDFILKKAFQLGDIKLSSERNANLTYDINNKLNDISCDMIESVFVFGDDKYNIFEKEYNDYIKSDHITSKKGVYQLG